MMGFVLISLMTASTIYSLMGEMACHVLFASYIWLIIHQIISSKINLKLEIHFNFSYLSMGNVSFSLYCFGSSWNNIKARSQQNQKKNSSGSIHDSLHFVIDPKEIRRWHPSLRFLQGYRIPRRRRWSFKIHGFGLTSIEHDQNAYVRCYLYSGTYVEIYVKFLHYKSH